MLNPVLIVFTVVWLTFGGSSAEGSMGPLEPYISADEGGAWQVELDQNSLQLRNGNSNDPAMLQSASTAGYSSDLPHPIGGASLH